MGDPRRQATLRACALALLDQVGLFLNLPEGRRYVVRLPNVAFSMTTDVALTGLMNHVVFTLGGSHVPNDAKPYTVRAVSELRRIQDAYYATPQ